MSLKDCSKHLFSALGKDTPFTVIIQSIVFAVILLCYVLYIGSFFGPTVYPLLDRVTYSTPFVDKYLASESVDSIIIILLAIAWIILTFSKKVKIIIATTYVILIFLSFIPELNIPLVYVTLTSLPMILFSIVIQKYFTKDLLVYNQRLCLNYVAIVAIALGIMSLTITLPTFFVPGLSLPSINYLYYVYLLFTVLTPLFLLVIALCIPIKIFIGKIKCTKIDQSKIEVAKVNSSVSISKKKTAFYLSAILALCIIVTIIPHIPAINPDNQTVGEDSPDYEQFLENLASPHYNMLEILHQAFVNQSSGDRALSLLIFFILSHIYNPANFATILEFLPILMGPLLILCTFVLTKELTNNYSTSLIASLLTIPFHVLIGQYAGLYANWLALILGYLVIYFLFRYLKSNSVMPLFMFSIMLLLVHFSHAPTWTIILLVLIIFLVICFIQNTAKRKTLLILFLALTPSIIVDIGKMFTIKTSGVIENISFANNQGFGFHDLDIIWLNLIDTTQIYMAGQIGNPILLFLVIYWIFICSLREKYTIFFMGFCSLPILPILFGEAEVTTRLLYEIPFQIPAAIALTRIKDQNGMLIFSAICFWIIIICLRTASNFYFNPII